MGKKRQDNQCRQKIFCLRWSYCLFWTCLFSIKNSPLVQLFGSSDINLLKYPIKMENKAKCKGGNYQLHTCENKVLLVFIRYKKQCWGPAVTRRILRTILNRCCTKFIMVLKFKLLCFYRFFAQRKKSFRGRIRDLSQSYFSCAFR